MGMVSFDSVAVASWTQLPKPLHFGISFNISAISLAIIYVVNAVQTIGDISSTTVGGLDREPTDKELSGGIISQGISSIMGAIIGGLPTATYSQNVGIVTVNRVVNKNVFTFAAIIMLIAGFATITMTGIRMIATSGLTPLNVSVVGLAVALGSGITSVPGALDGFPSWVMTIFGSSSVVIATIVAITLNLVLPKDSTSRLK